MGDSKYVHLPLFDEDGVELREYLKVDARYFITGPARYRTEVVEMDDTIQLVDVNSLFPEAVAIDRALYESHRDEIKEATEQEIETVDRIISGLPPKDTSWVGEVLARTSQSPWANKPFEKEEPPTEPTWVRIPAYKDYEVNSDGVVRNFWTKRVLSFGTDPTHTVEMHGADGNPRQVSIADIMKQTLGE